ncbi:MAG TPA: hypothetical protein PKE68_14005 [Saprospiraceae bacterium]|nr:hypothetical protein [Saprospiraceae bacterium]
MRTLLLLLFTAPILIYGQQKQYNIGAIGFYNLENLFDTIDSPDTRDSEFTPLGDNLYNTEVYLDKLNKLARVISELGIDRTPDGVAILGVAEVENQKVLEDLVAEPAIRARRYEIVHYDSPDQRGIDVGLLYQPKYYKVLDSRPVPVEIYNDKGERTYTRDILFVSGLFDGEPLHVLVNHWPSRRGGEAATQPLRNYAASLCKAIADSLIQADPNAKIIIWGI